MCDDTPCCSLVSHFASSLLSLFALLPFFFASSSPYLSIFAKQKKPKNHTFPRALDDADRVWSAWAPGPKSFCFLSHFPAYLTLDAISVSIVNSVILEARYHCFILARSPALRRASIGLQLDAYSLSTSIIFHSADQQSVHTNVNWWIVVRIKRV